MKIFTFKNAKLNVKVKNRAIKIQIEIIGASRMRSVAPIKFSP